MREYKAAVREALRVALTVYCNVIYVSIQRRNDYGQAPWPSCGLVGNPSQLRSNSASLWTIATWASSARDLVGKVRY